MKEYLLVVMVVYYAVSVMLLFAVGVLCGCKVSFKKALFASLVGAIYSGLCLMPACKFLNGLLIRLIVLIFVGMFVYGVNVRAVRKIGGYILLTMAAEGMALAVGEKNMAGLILAAFLVCLLCYMSGKDHPVSGRNKVIDLQFCNKHYKVNALVDTGNCLKDPISGLGVIVAGHQAAQKLLGLERAQLADPIGTMASSPVGGMRLVPYKAVGIGRGLLIGVRMKAKIDGEMQDVVVGFAAEGLDAGSTEALIGDFA